MSELISREAALDCFRDWIDRCGNEHTADEDATYQRIAELPAVQPEPDYISRQAAIDAIEKCYTCKHVYQRVSDADTLYCRCRKGCRYEEFKPKRSTGNPQWHEGEN